MVNVDTTDGGRSPALLVGINQGSAYLCPPFCRFEGSRGVEQEALEDLGRADERCRVRLGELEGQTGPEAGAEAPGLRG